MIDKKSRQPILSPDDKPIVFAASFVVLLLAVGTAYTLETQGIATLLSPIGRYIYAISNQEAAAYLAGVPPRRVIILGFCLCGMLSGLAGTLLAGYSTKAFQGIGDACLLPAIAAVVTGGTHIPGGRGRYLDTLLGVVLIVLLNSVLSLMHRPEAGRQIIYGSVIILMLLVFVRRQEVTQ
jgi:ribose transport system permease protein